MYSDDMEALIAAAIRDGVLTDKERSILHKKAKKQGIDLDEFDMILQDRLDSVLKEGKMECPECKESISDVSFKCPHCGHKFLPSKLLSDRLLIAAKDVGVQKNIVSVFPIPDEKADIVDLVKSLMAQMVNPNDELYYPYLLKCEQCIKKATANWPGDSIINSISGSFADEKKKYEAEIKEKSYTPPTEEDLEQKSNRINSHIWTCVKGLIIIGVLAFIGFLIAKCVNSPKSIAIATDADDCAAAIAKAIGNNQLDSAKTYIYNYQGEDPLGKSCIAVADAYLRSGDTITAIDVAKHAGDESDIMFPFYMKAKDFDDADKYIERPKDNGDDETAQHYYDFLASAVKSMCADGKINEAKSFITAKAGAFFDTNESSYNGGDGDNPFRRDGVESQLKAIVEQYEKKSDGATSSISSISVDNTET